MSRLLQRFATLSALGLAAGALAGCDVEPYCLTCVDGDVEEDAGPDAGARDGGPDTGPPDTGPDVGVGDGGCLLNELCNDEDDDCDGIVDEGIDLETDTSNCGECGSVCSPPHSFPVCEAGVCGIADCDVGWLDLNEDPEDGCEYRCLQTSDEDAICDLRDNDCDGEVDEDVELETDVDNCGSCGRVCRFPNSTASCAASMCGLESCADGFYDIDMRVDNGCEYACTLADPATETCNVRDDDCDGTIDEGDPGGGEACGDDTGACMMGVTQCLGGIVECVGAVEPTTELCNGVDDDCDGSTDESNPEGGRLCGSRTGVCVQGREVCTGGVLVCEGEVTGGAETCNGLDDDCDGSIDEGNPDGGASCGETTGACTAGMLTCVAGDLVCTGGVVPAAETCNGADDDCDGSTDEGNPDGGSLCGTDVGQCRPGVEQCMGGALVCTGATEAVMESCNGLDDDCDGSVDEGNPDGGASCGETTGACTAGTLTCRSGVLSCEGGTGPGVELCNMADDDCDGSTDEAFDFASDPTNCGSCGVACTPPNAIGICDMGSCAIAACLPGFFDLDAGMPGCEYECDFRGDEVCNGQDDDCDGVTDEGLVPPSNFCFNRGVCAGTTASCGGAAGWQCAYPGTFEDSETRCDGEDNDCDGATDETYPLAGTSCSVGTGACRGVGSYVCNADGDGVECDATLAAMPADEECNAADDDCDGLVDEVGVDDPGTAWRDALTMDAFDTVVVNRAGGGTMRMMQYEASRPDASAGDAGSNETLACSRAGVLPWTSVTWSEARDACCAMNEDGACPGAGETGWRLCEA
ncbi:MAG TPA: MopE-related protein, partial [Polyangiaceae bacterium LLY-WYZ-15_(1-7)]|nr:MopE-related protein [Polyangiaceae bacterium LLY-WYZ-15_(1-7)]